MAEGGLLRGKYGSNGGGSTGNCGSACAWRGFYFLIRVCVGG